MTASFSAEIRSAEEFVRLRTSNDPSEYGLAATGSAAVDVWKDVIERFPEMKTWVAHNKSIPLDILSILAGDPDADVRQAVAAKRKLNPLLFEILSKDANEGVRTALARNRKTPDYILERLRSDSSEVVRKAADR